MMIEFTIPNPHDVDAPNITIRLAKEGDTQSFEGGGRHEEGWSSWGETFTHAGDRVIRESGSDGVDCDGRLSSYSVCECPIADLAAHVTERGAFPKWERVTSGQRDYSAETAGY